jgi:D-alanyl-lipoteichoic acid acyltransferase DltB (MBOAT superfamily)
VKPVKKFFAQPLFWLTVCVLLSLFALVYPIYVIRPFRFQGPSELSLALATLRFRPALLISLSVAGAWVAVLCWRAQHCRTWQKIAACLCACLILALAFLERINVYELMFHPLDRPTFSRAQGAKLDGKEEVIAIQIAREARAYPIRIMSYHHIVNDVVGGLPVVATY